ncbi:hypothetical protein BDQ17DRAFT_1422133 [Cyathus striatus]|nr:hypothetical protein BDQ17DRAFT_1422133 [Cyathus striatus]
MPPIADSDPDPTTQIPWPTARPKQLNPDAHAIPDMPEPGHATEENHKGSPSPLQKRHLSSWNLFTLSVAMAGAQVAWTVELGYGTPFLMNLGLSERLTSLVWLAGPISGLVAQPVIGAVSDSSTSKYRRRFWIVLSTIALVVSALTLAYCKEFAAFFVDLLNVGEGDWDEKRTRSVHTTAIGFAVVSFYILDFALNGLQASLRNLLLDVAPPGQVNAGNAWHGRMTNAGNIMGYGLGFLPLSKLPIVGLLGGGQFRIFCIITIVILVVTVFTTCFYHEEEERPRATGKNPKNGFRDIIHNIYTTILNLPKPIRRVCCVQLFAFMGWFPFLFYSTTYVSQIMAYELGTEPDHEEAVRSGALAMLIYSIVGVGAGSILPHLASRDRRLMAHKEDVNEDAEITRLRATVRSWRVDAARKGKPLRLPVMPFLLRNIWTGALILFSFLMFLTFFISTVAQATIFISLVGICWAVAMWVPFAIIMELLKEKPIPTLEAPPRPLHVRNFSTPGLPQRPSDTSELQPLMRPRSLNEYDAIPETTTSPAPLAGGTILGIHNLAIVMPQFIVAIVTSTIFRIVDESGNDFAPDEDTYFGKNGVAWVLRFGGVCTLFAAMIARMVPPTPTEKAMRRRLGEMELLGEEGTP